MSKPPCTVYGDLMQRSKSGDIVGFSELMLSLEGEDKYDTAVNNQLAFFVFERAFRGDNVPDEGDKEFIITHLTFANFFSSFDDSSTAEKQIQFLAYAAILNILYETNLSDDFWKLLASPGENGLLNAKYRPVCVLRSLSPGVDQEDIYISPDYRTCMDGNKYVK